MPVPGNSEIALLAYWNGNPTGVSMSELNIAQGTLVLDFSTPALWQKTSTTDNSGFNNLLSTGNNLATRDSIQLVTDSSPLTGGTVTCNALGKDDIQYWTPAGTIAAQTYVFPSDANSQLGQIIEITSTHIVSALTLTTAGLTIVGTSQTALAVDTPARWRKVAAATWLVLA